MVYVALSRVRSLKGLFLTGFSPSKIQVHESVVEEYCRLKELPQKNTNDHDQCKKLSLNWSSLKNQKACRVIKTELQTKK